MKRSEGLDAIRGVAIALVLMWHILYDIVSFHSPKIGQLLILGWSGVDLFFVLSGFLIGGILLDTRDSHNFFRVFYARRALRILPLYFLTVIPFVLITDASIWPYLTFTQNFVWASQGQWEPSVLSPTWSLAVEEQFYLLLPLLVRNCSAVRLPYVLALLIASAPFARLGIIHIYGNPFAAYYLLPARMDALLLGVVAAWLMRDDIAGPWLARNRVLIAAAAALAFIPIAFMAWRKVGVLSFEMQTVGYTTIAAFYFCVLLLVVTRRKSDIPLPLYPLRWFGLGAYSLYLFHYPILEAARHLGNNVTIMTFAACAAAAVMCWFCIERPLIRFGHWHFKYV